MTVLVPSTDPDDWKPLLQAERHWRTGYSTRALAHCWSDATGFPREIQRAFDESDVLTGTRLLLAIPEHQVQLPDSDEPSHTDLWALGRTPSALVSMAVEGKVSETFGPTVDEWLVDASDNKRARLTGLLQLLRLDRVPGSTRYQLLHRTASAILEARRFTASHAVMLVHSFSQDDAHFDDFGAFASLLGAEPRKYGFARSAQHSEPTLHLGWVQGDPKYLAS
jgi:hypothetical protein